MTNKKIIPAVVSISIIALLLMLGPVKAFILGFSVLDNVVVKGEIINFQISVEIEQGEIIDIKNFTLVLEGPQNLTCTFLPNGSLLTPCPGIQIQQTENTTYQHGYGFLPGFLRYSINLDSDILTPGVYTSKYIVLTDVEQFESPEETITVLSPQFVESCSLRAINGLALFESEEFTSNNRLSLYVPAANANLGHGTFTAQESRTRLSYTFQVDNAFNINEETIFFDVSGMLRRNTDQYYEFSRITFNKTSLEIDLHGDLLEIENMHVSFMEC